MASIDDNITQLFDFASDAMTTARETASRINQLSPAIPNANLDYSLTKPNMPSPQTLGDLLAPDSSSSTIRFLDAESEKWLDKFFPEIQACLRTSPEEWLCGIITGQKPFGLSREVFEAVWHESRDREYRSRNATVRQIHANFSAAGFSMPTGAQVAAVLRAEEAAADAAAQVNREQTVKDAEIKLDLLKFAESEALKLKLGVLNAMADFYRQWIELPNKDLEASRIRTQAYAAFQSALGSYYNVQLGFEELRLQAASLRMNGALDVSRMKVGLSTGDNRNGAIARATQAFADVAAAASGAASTLNAEVATGGA